MKHSEKFARIVYKALMAVFPMSASNIVPLHFHEKSRVITDSVQYIALNFRLVNYIFRSKVCRSSRYDLIFLSCRMSDDGKDLLGDVVQMSRGNVLRYAEADSRIKKPDKIIDRLENLLSDIGFSLNMQAPEWVRSPQSSFADQIAQRNLQTKALGSRRFRSNHLRIVYPDL